MPTRYALLLRGFVLRIALLFLACFSPAVFAQQADSSPAPVPPEILSAKTAFVANLGGDCEPFGNNSDFTGGPDRAYNQFYAAIKRWGRYELVPSPVNASLIFEIHFTCPIRFDGTMTQIDAQVHVSIREPKTQTVLWGFTRHIEGAAKQSNRDRNFDKALATLVDDVKKLVARPDAVAALQN
jgi:hypothetical protein